MAVLGGANPGSFVVLFCFANSWLVCTGVLKPVLKGAEAGAEARGDFFEVRLTKRGGHGSLDLDEI